MVVMSQLSDSEKERYFEFLLENNVEFSKVENDYWVANVRLVVPNGSEEEELERPPGATRPPRAAAPSADERARWRRATRLRSLAGGLRVRHRRWPGSSAP